MNKRAVIYCRVSTKEQVDEGNSLVTQEKHCKDYALKNSYDIAEVFIEQGESAKTAQRTELQRLLSYCADKKNQVSAVISYKIDRISRNTDDYSQIRILLKRYGVEIKSTSEYFENTPAGRFMENIIANVAQFDNDVRSERCAGGMKEAMRSGRYVWCAPIGYDNCRVNGKCTIAQNELAELVQKTFKLVAQNIVSIEEVRRKVTGEGLISKTGKPVSKSQFYRMLKNELYTGVITKFGERHKGTFEPIISESVFYQVQRVIKYRARYTGAYIRENPDFPLRRFVKHPSGLKLTGAWSQGKKKKYPYYLFHIKGNIFKRELVENAFLRLLDEYALDGKHFGKLKSFLSKAFSKETNRIGSEQEKNSEKISALNLELRELSRSKAKGLISDYLYRQQVEFIERELMELQSVDSSSLSNGHIDIEGLLTLVKEFLKKPSEIWRKASFEKKLALQVFYFPKGVIFDGVDCRTPEVCFIFKVKSFFLTHLSHKVELARVELACKTRSYMNLRVYRIHWFKYMF